MSRSRWVAPALWAVLIELLTSWPQPPNFGAPEHSDKVAHVGMFAVFAFLAIRAAQVGRPSVRAMAITLLALVVWAALDEWHQKFIPGREGGVADWIADSIGVVLGLGIRWMKPQRISAGTR